MIKKKAFSGGVHPHDGKELTNTKNIKIAPLMKEYAVSLSQHIGAPAKAIVKVGDTVLKGQKIAEANGFVSVPIHAPTSGTIISKNKKTSAGGRMEGGVDSVIGPTGALVPMLTISADGEDTPCNDLEPILSWQDCKPEDLKQRVLDAGIVGMGGAAFPTHVKLSPPPSQNIDTLVINASECEPYLSADHRQMLEDTKGIIEGILIIKSILGIQKVCIGIESNKPDAIKAMQEESRKHNIVVTALPTMYPQGSEKQLIYAITGRKVPMGKLPMETGCVVQNIGTAFAIYEAVVKGKPLYERITTITGSPIVNPSNWRLRVGTSLADALTLAEGVKNPDDIGKVILGGPMMGMAQFSLDVPIMKNTSGILLLNKQEVTLYTSGPCIRCGSCINVCPQSLMPSTMGVQIEKERFELAEETNIMNCIECGCCSYVCPSHRPLVQLFRRGKSEIQANNRKKKV